MQALNGGRLGLLRFYDPRLFPVLFSHVLQPEQCEGVGPVALSDAQVDILGCAADATRAIAQQAIAFPLQWGAEQRFQACYRGMLEACREGLLVDVEREAFVSEQVRDV
ncbi:hypothetical protein [Pseudomonas sp. PSKL.D1]|uniref:hypothetical protein n=1 Tax=Pseudomonas sp. PSKL.D1 TaxID=3029060 RepID=UPI003158C6B4